MRESETEKGKERWRKRNGKSIWGMIGGERERG